MWIILSLWHPSVSSLGQYHLNHQGNVLHQKQVISSQAGSSGSWAPLSGGLSLCTCGVTWSCELLSFSGEERSVPVPPPAPPSPLPQIAKSRFLRKGGAVFCNSYKASVLSAWFLSPHLTHSHWTYVCAFPQPRFACVNWLFSKLERPNSQAMSVWIKGTWESLFMSDLRKFPVSCLSGACWEHAGKMGSPSPGKIWSLLSPHFTWSNRH